jgi:DNA-directed RNA polymerase subunit E'/Rpb7
MNDETVERKVFKYNMSFYYQSTIIYFVVFVLYILIRGEFIEDSFILITKDPIIYFFAIIVFISVLSLLYNIYKNRRMEISDEGISFIDRFKTRNFKYEDMIRIKISKKKKQSKRSPLRLIRIKLKNRRRLIVVRPSDYENADELLKVFDDLRMRIEKV